MQTTAHSPEPTATLLVVDDDRDIRLLLANSLGARGYRVETAANTRDMDQILAREAIDLVILDVMIRARTGSRRRDASCAATGRRSSS
jgi:two-component system OmpR family response regulator